MATVKSSDSKRQIAQPTSNKPPQKSDGKALVKVVKNGIERTFPRAIWDNLPAGKEGYQEVVETPKLPADPDAEAKAKEEADAKAKADADQKAADDKAAADLKAKQDAEAKANAGNQNKPSPTYDEAVKAYTDAYGEKPGQDLSIEEILAKVTAKKQEGK